jgi:hypothetical protein
LARLRLDVTVDDFHRRRVERDVARDELGERGTVESGNACCCGELQRAQTGKVVSKSLSSFFLPQVNQS